LGREPHASVAGSSDAVAEGLPLDEQSQLELALFLSLEEARAQADRRAATAAVASPPPAASPSASSEASGRQDRPYGPATRARQSATAMAAAASSAAVAAAVQAEAAAQRAGDAVNAQVASAHDTVHAVMDRVDAVLRSLPGFNGPLLSRADAADTHDSDSIQQEEAELAWAARQMASSSGSGEPIGLVPDDLRQDIFMPSGFDNLPEWFCSANEGSSAPSGGDSQAASVAASNPAVATAVAARMHSFTSDDSSFDFADAPHAGNMDGMPAAPTDQFAALSLLDLDTDVPGPSAVASVSHMDMLESGIQYLPEEQSDSPFFAGNDSPFAVGCQTAGFASSGDHAVPISYPRIDRPNQDFSSEGPSSAIVYPQVARPAPTPAEHASLTPVQGVDQSCGPPSPRTQMHNLALGGDMLHGNASWIADAEGWEAAPCPGPVVGGTSQGGPFIGSLEQAEPTTDMAAGSEHVGEHGPPLVFFRPSDEPMRRPPAPEQSVTDAVEHAGSEHVGEHGPPLVFFRTTDEPMRRQPASEQSETSGDANYSAEGPASIHVHQGIFCALVMSSIPGIAHCMVIVALSVAFALQPGTNIKLLWCSQVYFIWLFWQTLRSVLCQGCCKWQYSMLCMGTNASHLAVIAEEAEGHLANNRLAALSGHGELSQEDSSEWELVSSDADED